MASVRHQYILVGIETDSTRYHGENASRPAILDRANAEQVLAHLATDLVSMFPAISHCALTMAGALFDQTQVLRPDMLVYSALQSMQESSNPVNDFQPRLLSIGARHEKMPLLELQPSEDIPLGILQVLPLVISGPGDLIESLAEDMEHQFLESGQLSAHSAKGLESQFKITVNHARFMTMTDLNAMLHLQLEHLGFLPLWELLDAAINSPQEIKQVETANGLKFEWRDGVVHTFFESFDWWANLGAGKDKSAAKQRLQSDYVDWTREYRQYLTMLDAYGIKVSQHLPGIGDVELKDSFLLEESTMQPQASAAAVTQHHSDDLGTVVVTVVSGKRQINFYPLQASGLNDLHQFIRDEGFSGDVAFPGCICYNESSRQLVPELLEDV